MEILNINSEHTMSSREIAELTGKPHNDVLKAIRKMEPAWFRITKGNFSLSEYQDSTGRNLPEYLLAKRECLFVATKFNDEARAMLIVRWEELENKMLQPALPKDYLTALKALTAEVEAKQKAEQQVMVLAPKARAWERFCDSDGLINTRDICNAFNFRSPQHMHEDLRQKGVLKKGGSHWLLTSKYTKFSLKFEIAREVMAEHGGKVRQHLKWTVKGLQYLAEKFYGQTALFH